MTLEEAGIKIEELLEKLQRHPESHKGENGRVTVIGGSVDYTGAPALAAQAALRSGSDLAKVLTSEKVRDVVAGFSENLIVSGYPGEYLQREGFARAFDMVEWSDTAVIGPGLGEPDPEVLRELVSEVKRPLVIDADAIESCLEVAENSVFTPHRGEAEIIEERYGSLQGFCDETGNVVLRKGSKDLVVTSGRQVEIETGHPGMTVGGTGDVLAGIVASLISQGLSPEKASLAGSYVTGKTGEYAAEEYGDCLLATDLVQQIPYAMKSFSC